MHDRSRAVVRGHVNVAADVSGWLGGPIGAALKLLVLAGIILYHPALLGLRPVAGSAGGWAAAITRVATPVAIGVGQIIGGWWSREPRLERVGAQIAGVGFALFLAGAVFFEGIARAGGTVATLVASPADRRGYRPGHRPRRRCRQSTRPKRSRHHRPRIVWRGAASVRATRPSAMPSRRSGTGGIADGRRRAPDASTGPRHTDAGAPAGRGIPHRALHELLNV